MNRACQTLNLTSEVSTKRPIALYVYVRVTEDWQKGRHTHYYCAGFALSNLEAVSITRRLSSIGIPIIQIR